MNIKALITTLFLGTSSVALAHPVSFGADAEVNASLSWGTDYGYNGYWQPAPVVRDHRAPMVPAPIVRDHRAPMLPLWAQRGIREREFYGSHRGWVELSAGTRNEDVPNHVQQISVGADKGLFRTIELVPTNGSTYVKQLTIGFTDGTYQTIFPNRYLTVGAEPIRLDIEGSAYGRTIQRVLVFGLSYGNAHYSVIGA